MKRSAQIPPKGFVRVIGVVLFVIGLAMVYVGIVNISTLGWTSTFVILPGLATAGFAATAVYTGDPEWILLDLMFPY